VEQQFALDLGRVDVDAAGDEHVLLPPGDRVEAVGVAAGRVAGVEPAVGIERRSGRLRVVPVAEADMGAAQPQLADLAERLLGALLVV
jgi:hypothetical protein